MCAYNILVTIKLMYFSECVKNYVPISPIQNQQRQRLPLCGKEQIADNMQKIFNNMDLRLGRWDNRRLYKMYDNVIVGSRFSEANERFTVTLATQSSLEKLISLTQVAKHWSGPISIAVFAAGDDELNRLILYITHLRECFSDIQEKVAFHFAFPKDYLPTSVVLDPDLVPNCDDPEVAHRSLSKIKSADRWRVKLPYPQNHLRYGVVRSLCSKALVLS